MWCTSKSAHVPDVTELCVNLIFELFFGFWRGRLEPALALWTAVTVKHVGCATLPFGITNFALVVIRVKGLGSKPRLFQNQNVRINFSKSFYVHIYIRHGRIFFSSQRHVLALHEVDNAVT